MTIYLINTNPGQEAAYQVNTPKQHRAIQLVDRGAWVCSKALYDAHVWKLEQMDTPKPNM